MSFLWPDYISPDLRLSDMDRRDIRNSAIAQLHKSSVYRCFGVLLAVFVAGTVATGMYFELTGLWRNVTIGCSWAITFTAFALFRRYTIVRHFRLAVRHKGYNVCIGCGYWLRGLDDSHPRCPECGQVSQRIGRE